MTFNIGVLIFCVIVALLAIAVIRAQRRQRRLRDSLWYEETTGFYHWTDPDGTERYSTVSPVTRAFYFFALADTGHIDTQNDFTGFDGGSDGFDGGGGGD